MTNSTVCPSSVYSVHRLRDRDVNSSTVTEDLLEKAMLEAALAALLSTGALDIRPIRVMLPYVVLVIALTKPVAPFHQA